MPFYRSNFGSSSGGGGGGGSTDSPYLSFTSTDNSYPILYNATFNSYANYDPSVITNIKIGNRVQELYFCFGDWRNLNAPVDLRNATMLINMDHLLYNCENFNSTFYFPDYFSQPMGEDESLYYSCCGVFGSCFKFNQPVALRMHDHVNTDHYTFSKYEEIFYNCSNFNSKVTFDFEKLNTNAENIYNSIISYSCQKMFDNCTNFNQPMVFPAGICSSSYIFNNCRNFNQPVVFDLYCSDGVYFENLFNTAFNMHSSIILLNVEDSSYSSMFKNFVNSAYENTIYIKNSAGILNNNVVGRQLTWTTSTAPNNASCNVYYNSDFNITISEDVDDGLNQFNNYYYNFYGEYPVIPIY